MIVICGIRRLGLCARDLSDFQNCPLMRSRILIPLVFESHQNPVNHFPTFK